jgi:two-component system sensor histidine kinase KdpD
MQIKRISGPWKSAERLMVAVSPSPLSERLVRWTRRMAYNLKAPWLAVFVEPTQPLSDEQKTQLARNLSLVHKLGGEVVTTSGSDVVETLMRVARQRNVTQIVIGKPARNRLQELLRGGSVVNQLVHASGEIDVYVVSGDKEEEPDRSLVTRPGLHSEPNQYMVAFLVVSAAVGICYFISISTASVVIGYQEIALILLLMIVLLANFLGRGPILLAATLSALLWNYLFIPPRFTFFITSLRDILIFGLYFIVALVTGNLTARQRAQARALRLREERMSAFSMMAQEVAHALTLDDVLQTAVEQVSQVFGAEIAILLPDAAGHLSSTPRLKSTMNLDLKELSVATWAFEHGQPAGRFTETLPTASTQYVPLVTPGGVVGVMGIQRAERLSVDQEVLLNTFANHIALAVEHALLAETARHTAVLNESERLASTLLDSVSLELRTPIAAIREAATALIDAHQMGDEGAELAYDNAIQTEATQLARVVDNLLDMTRLESGHLQLNLGWHSVSDLVSQSLKRVDKELANHELVIDVPADLPPVRVDLVLMEQVLVNLLHNAAVYTPKGVRVRVTARVEEPELVLSVADRGPGLPPADLKRVFEKFYRAPGSTPGGTGLGLSICRGLVEAHGGTISAENRPHGGARFTIRLPISKASNPNPTTDML